MEAKNAFLMVAILAVSAVLLSGCVSNQGNGNGPLVGNDSDEHGCKASAGYSWCEAKQKCIRIWEENCSSCTCPDNYIQEANACNPKCYYSTPPCLMPSVQCRPAGCGECPQYMPPGPDFCKNGTIVSGETNECGCVGPPKCEQNSGNVGIANPASVYCEQNGGTLEIVNEADGQVGICTLSNGTKCEEWAYFRGECP